MERKLIKAVRLHPCLYDRSSPLFRNLLLKERQWKAVAISTGASVEQCKQRWKSLRDRFVREIVAQKSKSEEEGEAEEKKEWCYLKLMGFLTKHVNPRKSKTQFGNDDQHSCSDSPATTQNNFEWVELLQEESAQNDSQTCRDTPKPKDPSKRQRIDEEQHTNNEAFERLARFYETMETVFSTQKESKNKAFLAMLDELLQKKTEEMQDRLKMEILNHVHNS
ncbi:PREDICTED: transcription factor Adf-1-like [Bactrocera latifrons]|uniref:transcription factor Adf-1-like n=1 Tax=Bactrocera latifrons TaxID=174628 RepID=UPI0008DE8B2C|nr:PREDICTED: transcription factor Adf-1-like [Bactrocera latifrons]